MGHKISELTVKVTLDGTETFPCNDSGVTKQCSVDAILGRALHVEKITLDDADIAGGILAWQNPADVDIIIFDVRLRVNVAPTTPGGNNIAVPGVADDATSAGTPFGVPIALDQSPVPALVIGNARAIVPAGKYVNLSSFTDDGGSATGLVGFVYIYWHLAV